MMATNVIGLMTMTTTFTKGMRVRKRGHVINISSISGHYTYAGGSVYCASKFAVDGYTTAIRQDLVSTPIKVTAISPGSVNTEFAKVRFDGDEYRVAKTYDDLVPLSAEDVADQVMYAATRPPHVQIGEIIVWPTNQAPGMIARVGPTLGA